jgi:hypothetical protein
VHARGWIDNVKGRINNPELSFLVEYTQIILGQVQIGINLMQPFPIKRKAKRELVECER